MIRTNMRTYIVTSFGTNFVERFETLIQVAHYFGIAVNDKGQVTRKGLRIADMTYKMSEFTTTEALNDLVQTEVFKTIISSMGYSVYKAEKII